MNELTFIEALRGIATDPAARGLNDDCAVLELGTETLILTHDVMVSGVHFLADADPADVAWKLVAVNLSDLASKGAQPLGVMLGFMLNQAAWNQRFIEGLSVALAAFNLPLLGGDTVSAGRDATASYGITAIGRATSLPVPSRSGAKPGDALLVTGPIGDAYAGFELVKAGASAPADLVQAYLRPRPLVEVGQRLAPHVHAMMDVSDGLLLDASRIATASGLGLEIDLGAVPFSPSCGARHLPHHEMRAAMAHIADTAEVSWAQQAITWGDDYQLLFAAPLDASLPVDAWPVGRFVAGAGLSLSFQGSKLPLPASLGFQHR
jgi:thiamine-monophosphate kinase